MNKNRSSGWAGLIAASRSIMLWLHNFGAHLTDLNQHQTQNFLPQNFRVEKHFLLSVFEILYFLLLTFRGDENICFIIQRFRNKAREPNLRGVKNSSYDSTSSWGQTRSKQFCPGMTYEMTHTVMSHKNKSFWSSYDINSNTLQFHSRSL